MNDDVFKEIENCEDEMLKSLVLIKDKLKQNIRISTGVSQEFKESLMSDLIEILSIVNKVNTWDRI